MQQTEGTQKVSDLIARYQQELLAMHKRQQHTAPPPAPSGDNWLNTAYPLPDIEQDRAALAAVAPPPQGPVAVPEQSAVQPETFPTAEVAKPEEPPAEAAAGEEPAYPYTDEDLQGQVPRPEDPAPPAESPAYTGYLRVYVFTANSAEPLAGARVTVTRPAEDRDEVLFASATTDGDGFTQVIPLPSVNPALTMRPDVPQPYVTYNIRVQAEGFSPTRYENVPVYGDNYVTQPAAMVPLLPGQSTGDGRTFYSKGPADL